MDLAISNATLPNGLRVVLVRDPRAHDIQVTMRYGVGAADDPPGQEGLAHLVEHLMFQQVVGTESIFAKLEAQAHGFNAFTTADATTYVTRAAPDKLEALLAIEGARLGFRCTSVTPSTFEREREVVVNELRMRGKIDAVFNAFNRAVYTPTHPYARDDDPARVEALTMEQACAFADAHYAPGNAVIVLSGNLDQERASAALGKLLARLSPRNTTATVQVLPPRAMKATQKAPLSRDGVLIAWPLARDPSTRVRMLAMFGLITLAIDGEVKGRVVPLSLGDQRAPMVGVVIINDADERSAEVLTRVRKALADVPAIFQGGRFGQLLFNRVQQLALYDTFSGFEDGSDRDSQLAAQVLAGRDPQQVLAATLRSLNTMTSIDARVVVAQSFSLDDASVVELRADEQTRGGDTDTISRPVHDVGQHRDVPDPTEAMRPMVEELSSDRPIEPETRTLPNGMRVVLLPVTSVPAVDVRVVFNAGTADEPATKRGAALVAAEALAWRESGVNDVLALAESGGSSDVEVTRDHVVFSAHGLDMHLDYLLRGLQKLVVDGGYSGGGQRMERALQARSKREETGGALADAYLQAQFGATHPYTEAGLARHVSSRLTLDDARAFRAAHFTPDNATLVISGRFDRELAIRWVDHLFSGWKGKAEPRDDVRAAVQPASLASEEARPQVLISMTLPATRGTRAARMVAAAMLREITNDVRHKLGAAYVLDASYDELRLSTTYSIVGAVDAPRMVEALTLIRDRLASVHTEPEAAARAFVSARKRVLAALTSTTGSAAALGESVTRDVSLLHGLLDGARVAQEVHALTIDQMTPALVDLDLGGAAILMRGPKAEVAAAFGVLGRTPQLIPSAPAATTDFSAQVSSLENDDGDDDGPSTSRFLSAGALTFSNATVHGIEMGWGRGVSLQVGLDIKTRVTAGLMFSYGNFAATHPVPFKGTQPFELEAMRFSLFVQRTFLDRLWAEAFIGINVDGITEERNVGPLWRTGISVGAEAGVDLLRTGRNRITASARYVRDLDTYTDYRGYTLGVGYRFY